MIQAKEKKRKKKQRLCYECCNGWLADQQFMREFEGRIMSLLFESLFVTVLNRKGMFHVAAHLYPRILSNQICVHLLMHETHWQCLNKN